MARQEVVFLLLLVAGSLAAPVDDPQVSVLPQSAQVSEEVTGKPARLSDPVTQVTVQDAEEQQDTKKGFIPTQEDIAALLKEALDEINILKELIDPSNQIKVDGVAETTVGFMDAVTEGIIPPGEAMETEVGF